jgi:hypothetical protein
MYRISTPEKKDPAQQPLQVFDPNVKDASNSVVSTFQNAF